MKECATTEMEIETITRDKTITRTTGHIFQMQLFIVTAPPNQNIKQQWYYYYI